MGEYQRLGFEVSPTQSDDDDILVDEVYAVKEDSPNSRWSIQEMFHNLKEKFKERTVAKKDKFYFQSADVFRTIDENDDDEDLYDEDYNEGLNTDDNSSESMISTMDFHRRNKISKKKCSRKQIRRFLYRQQSWIFLMVLGVLSALIGITAEKTSSWIIDVKMLAGSATGYYIVNYMLWILISVLLAIISATITHFNGPYSAGSGIPAMKSILSGVILSHYLSYRTLLSKTVGSTIAYSAGMFIGREGPSAHICAALANQIAKLPIFSRIRKNDGAMLQMIAAGCAVGVAATFGSPIGGVFFSIEATSTYYHIQNLAKGLFCALSTTVVLRLLTGNSGLVGIAPPDYDKVPYKSYELFIFAFIGIILGLLSALFIAYIKKIQYLRRNFKVFNESRYGQVIVVGIVSALVTYPILPLREGATQMLSKLLSAEDLKDWATPNLYFILIVVIVLYFLLCGITLGLPIACGLYAPIFILGAATGRLFGELLALTGLEVTAGGYAAVGAAALGAGVTRTISSAIILFELTGQMTLLIPVMLAVLISSAVANLFGPSLYDELLRLKGLPYLPPYQNHKNKTARSIMRRKVVFIGSDATYADVKKLLNTSDFSHFPLVDSSVSRLFIGAISRVGLESILERYEAKFKSAEGDLLGMDLGISANLSRESPGLDPCPFQVVPETPLSKVHFMFAMLGLSVSYVVDHGVLVGVISRKDMMNYSK